MPLPGFSGMAGFAPPIVFQSFAEATAVGGTTIVVDKPTGTVSGDILVAIMAMDAAARTWTGDTSWTEIIDEGTNTNLRAAYLVAGGSEPSNYTFTASGTGQKAAQILCFRGFQFDVGSASVTTSAADGALAIGGITSAGGILIAAVASGPTGTPAHSTPTGMQLVTSVDGGAQVQLTTFWQEVAAGATGTRSSTISGGTNKNGGILIGLKP